LLASRTLIVALALAVGACGGPRGPRGLLDAVLAADEAAVEEFIAAGADVRATEADGTTLLMRAVDSGNVAIAAQLIGAGADVRAANRYGVNPLYLAARNANRDAVAVLLAAGADPNASLPSGETALMTAAKTGNAAVVEMLLAGRPTTDPQAPSGFLPRNPGADPNAADSWNRQTALMWAAGDGHVDVVRALLTGGAAVDQRSASLDSTDSLGLDYPEVPAGRSTALHFAAGEGHLAATRALVAGGAGLNLTDDQGSTPALLAVLNGHFDVAAFLLDAGTDPNIQDRYGRTVLFAAVHLDDIDSSPWTTPNFPNVYNAVDVVKLALAHGAQPDLALERALPSYGRTDDGTDSVLNAGATPFFRAAMSADLELMRLLLDAGANPLVRTAERLPVAASGESRATSGATTAFMAAAGVGWRPPVRLNRQRETIMALEMLLELGADINASNQAGETALHGAARRGSTAIISWLVEHGARLDATNARGYTPLDVARGAPGDRPPANPAAVELLRPPEAPGG
jgi:ankyrin repeat protein